MADEQTKTRAPLFVPSINEFRRDVDFVSRYANNIQVESNAFDLKMTFGILDQRAGMKDISAKPSVDQHTAINIVWPEVKLLIFWLQVHLAGFEMENGKVQIPQGALPVEVPEILSEKLTDPKQRAALDMMRKMRAEFIAKLKD